VMYTSGLQACRGVVCGFIIGDVQIQKYPTIRYVTRNCGGLVGVTQIHHESKKQDTKLLAITSPTIIRFSKFFSLADSVVNLQQIHV